MGNREEHTTIIVPMWDTTVHFTYSLFTIMKPYTPLIAKDSGGADFKIIEPGNYVARCIQVIDIGTIWNEKYEKDSRKIRISWEFPTELEVFKEEKGEQPFIVSSEYTLSLSSKAILRKDLESWRGKPFTEEELEGFDLHNILGVPCMVQIIHTKSVDGTKTYANVSSVSSIPKGMVCPEQINESIWFNMEDFNEKIYNDFPDYIKDKISKCKEYKALLEAKGVFGE